MIKSAWAYKNGKRTMAKCKESLTPEKISFVNRRGIKLYAEYGNVKVYANKKQANKKVTNLINLGHNVERSFKYPYTIILLND